VFGQTGVLITLVALTIVVAGVFLVRPAITAGATGKILAFVALFVLPTLCIGAGMSFHLQRSQQTAYCVSCHSMESHGQSLHVLNTNYIPAQHFQNHLVPPDQACYTCHTDYTMYGPLKGRIKGLRYIYMEYVSSPPKTIHLHGKYSNLQCLHCHTGMRSFDENSNHTAIMGSLKTNQISCISCHDTIHNASEVAHLKMWIDGDVPVPSAVESSSSAPAKAETAAIAGPSKSPSGSFAGNAVTTRGKGIFDSHGCSGCHGQSGGGSSGPALTHAASKYSPAQLTAVLKAPTGTMKAAGMVPLTVNAADMKALVSYVTAMGGTSATSAAKPPPAGSPSPVAAKMEPIATPEPSITPAGISASTPTVAQGKAIFDSQHCGGCHGGNGGGGSGPALTHSASQYPPAQLTAVLKEPTATMKAAGMVPLTVDAADMEALVSYVSSLGGKSAGTAATPTSNGSTSPAPAAADPSATTVASKVSAGNSAGDPITARGKIIFDSKGCSGCHGEGGGGGTGPALAHISSHFSPAQMAAVRKAITEVLNSPTARMKAAGMVPLSLNSADMEALASYVSNIRGAAAASSSKLPAAGSAEDASAAHGKAVFDSQHCTECHGDAGVGSSGPALTHISSQYPPAKLTAVLKAPTSKMKASGMVPLTVSAADMKALVTYITNLGRASTPSLAAPPAGGSSSHSSAEAGQAPTVTPSKPEIKKKGIL
jgi:cytochrome c-type protein NapC